MRHDISRPARRAGGSVWTSRAVAVALVTVLGPLLTGVLTEIVKVVFGQHKDTPTILVVPVDSLSPRHRRSSRRR